MYDKCKRMQRSLNGGNNFSSLIGNALNKYANLADVTNQASARTNIGLLGSLTVDPTSSANYLSLTHPFDGTTNTLISVTANTIPTANSLVAYDSSGNISTSTSFCDTLQAYTSSGSISLNSSLAISQTNTFYITQQGLVASGTQPYLTIIGSSGNVGIGSSTPSKKLDVAGSIRSTNIIYSDTLQANTSGGAITTNSDIKFGTANMHIKDSNGANALTFDGSGNITFSGNITSPNLYRTIWNQTVNGSLSTTTSLGTSFANALTYTSPFTMTTTPSYRLVVPFTYYGETHLIFNVFLQFFTPSGRTPTICLEIYSSTNTGFNGLYSWTTTNPTNNAYLKTTRTISSSVLTIGNCYFVALSDYTISSSTAFGYVGGEISLANT